MRLSFTILFLLLLFGCKHISAPAPVDEYVMALAEQGVSEAQNNLGVMYKDGQGVDQDYNEAARWFLLAAQQDNTLAQLNLGWLYHAGKDLCQDTDSARYWYSRAARKGHATAQLNLGILYLQQADTTTAIYWLQQASQQDNSGAQRILQHFVKNK